MIRIIYSLVESCRRKVFQSSPKPNVDLENPENITFEANNSKWVELGERKKKCFHNGNHSNGNFHFNSFIVVKVL